MRVAAATPADVDSLSRLLARAFRDDPMHRWIFPAEPAWARGSHRSFAAAIRQELPHGSVLTTDDRFGAAIWRDPAAGHATFMERLRLAVRMLPLLGRRAFLVGRGFDQLEALHPPEPHWYLSAIGTDPEHQGRGIGSALMRHVLARCDAAGQSAYLEASRPDNVPYYQRHGFAVVREFRLPQGPVIWPMLRAPRL